jgi:Sulfotransferase domain
MNLRELRAIVCYHTGLARHLFIHIPKNAGVSVRKSPVLQNRLVGAEPYFHKSRAYTRELARYMSERGEHHGFHHARWRDIHPDVRTRLQLVAIIRNPWARTVSRYRFARLAMQNGKAKANYAADSFEAFLEERHQYGGLPFYWHRVVRGWYPQADYVVDDEGLVTVDLLRHEDLDADVMRYFALSEPLRKRNLSGTGAFDYRSYYSPASIQIVADWYKADIELFGFDFDTGAIRNTVFSSGMVK